jgi:hypothetical protein
MGGWDLVIEAKEKEVIPFLPLLIHLLHIPHPIHSDFFYWSSECRFIG